MIIKLNNYITYLITFLIKTNFYIFNVYKNLSLFFFFQNEKSLNDSNNSIEGLKEQEEKDNGSNKIIADQ